MCLSNVCGKHWLVILGLLNLRNSLTLVFLIRFCVTLAAKLLNALKKTVTAISEVPNDFLIWKITIE